MSEFIDYSLGSDLKWRLRVSVSAITLAALFPATVFASDNSRPTVWIEVGGQLERLTNGQSSFSPPFVAELLQNPFTSPASVQRPPRQSFGQEARILFRPDNTDWQISAAIRYGRSNRHAQAHEETLHPASVDAVVSIPALGKYVTSGLPLAGNRFATTAFQMRESHTVVDFSAGKDIGLGVFGRNGTSSFDAGVRFAQFTSRSSVEVDSDPDFHVTYKYRSTFAGQPAFIKIPSAQWNLYSGRMESSRSFTGAGPSASWSANAMLLGDPENASVTVDWGLNGSLLFGRQKISAHHTTTAHHGSQAHGTGALPTLYPAQGNQTARSRSVIVPNVGVFAGLSLRFPNAKISLGYRMDAFFGAMDGGIDTRKTYDRNFYGPFATISIGLGG